jgi:colanic acid biosynthesis glycosyl transferase WcaI
VLFRSALAEALLRLADDPARREQMGRNARAYAEQHLNRDVILTGFEQQLTELVDGRKKVRKTNP